jgi:8-oxo-dGTP pyrophosphatase MutT (NUDIX family)
MSENQFPLSLEEFNAIYAKVPRLTVEIIVKNAEGAVFLTKRAIEPCKGDWHLPGGTVFFGESLLTAVKRIAQRELGLVVIRAHSNGYIEYPSHYLHGMDQPVGLDFEVDEYSNKLKTNEEALDSGWFTSIPAHMHGDQDTYLVDNGYMRGN